MLVPAAILLFCFALAWLSYPSAFLRVSLPSRSTENWPACHNTDRLRVFVADLPEELNYGLLKQHWSRQVAHAHRRSSESSSVHAQEELRPYPVEPLWKQHSAEYWLLADLLTPPENQGNSTAVRVLDSAQADVVFVPFFATLSAKMQLAKSRGKFRHKKENEDYERQRRVVDIVKNSSSWQRSHGVDHIFVLTGWFQRLPCSPLGRLMCGGIERGLPSSNATNCLQHSCRPGFHVPCQE